MENENKEQKIWIGLSETIKTGSYENIKIEAGFSKIYTEDDNPVELIEEGLDELSEVLKKKSKKVKKKNKL